LGGKGGLAGNVSYFFGATNSISVGFSTFVALDDLSAVPTEVRSGVPTEILFGSRNPDPPLN
jgi:hypothetical protein